MKNGSRAKARRRKEKRMNKKRHHYVPKAYLKHFCSEEGKIHIYLKDDPGKVIYQSPDNTGFHKYYYSQPLPEGGRDNNKLENHFSELEAKWPPIIEKIQKRENVNDYLENIFQFITLQRIRVPACRDMIEKSLAETMKTHVRMLDESGKLPPKPQGFEDILDHVEVSIDPHQSILAMVKMIEGIGEKVLNHIGIRAVFNMTEIPFLTSDNPVIWFDPAVPEDEMKPYVLKIDGPIVLYFPISPNILIYGDSFIRERFGYHGLEYSEVCDPTWVEMVNQQICRFAYKAVYSQKTGQEDLINKYNDESPVLRTETTPIENGNFLFSQMVFGKRGKKPKWTNVT